MSHAAAEAWVGSSGLPGQFLLGDDGEFVGEGVAVCHWGPAFVGLILEKRHGVGWFRGCGCFDADGNGHIPRGCCIVLCIDLRRRIG